MNLTTTRAGQTACAEPGLALRRLYNLSIEPGLRQESHEDRGHASSLSEDRPAGLPVQTDDERFGMVLLGIGYDSSVA
jgi:hypothetical protein